MLNQLKNRKGFTLIEIVIVIIVIAILAAILVPSLTSWIDRSKVATIQESCPQIRSSLMAQLYEEAKNGGSIKNITQATYADDDDFWSELSERANTTLQCEDEDEDGYLEFDVGDGDDMTITYKTNGHTATFEDNVWTVE